MLGVQILLGRKTPGTMELEQDSMWMLQLQTGVKTIGRGLLLKKISFGLYYLEQSYSLYNIYKWNYYIYADKIAPSCFFRP